MPRQRRRRRIPQHKKPSNRLPANVLSNELKKRTYFHDTVVVTSIGSVFPIISKNLLLFPWATRVLIKKADLEGPARLTTAQKISQLLDDAKENLLFHCQQIALAWGFELKNAAISLNHSEITTADFLQIKYKLFNALGLDPQSAIATLGLDEIDLATVDEPSFAGPVANYLVKIFSESVAKSDRTTVVGLMGLADRLLGWILAEMPIDPADKQTIIKAILSLPQDYLIPVECVLADENASLIFTNTRGQLRELTAHSSGNFKSELKVNIGAYSNSGAHKLIIVPLSRDWNNQLRNLYPQPSIAGGFRQQEGVHLFYTRYDVNSFLTVFLQECRDYVTQDELLLSTGIVQTVGDKLLTELASGGQPHFFALGKPSNILKQQRFVKLYNLANKIIDQNKLTKKESILWQKIRKIIKKMFAEIEPTDRHIAKAYPKGKLRLGDGVSDVECYSLGKNVPFTVIKIIPDDNQDIVILRAPPAPINDQTYATALKECVLEIDLVFITVEDLYVKEDWFVELYGKLVIFPLSFPHLAEYLIGDLLNILKDLDQHIAEQCPFLAPKSDARHGFAGTYSCLSPLTHSAMTAPLHRPLLFDSKATVSSSVSLRLGKDRIPCFFNQGPLNHNIRGQEQGPQPIGALMSACQHSPQLTLAEVHDESAKTGFINTLLIGSVVNFLYRFEQTRAYAEVIGDALQVALTHYQQQSAMVGFSAFFSKYLCQTAGFSADASRNIATVVGIVYGLLCNYPQDQHERAHYLLYLGAGFLGAALGTVSGSFVVDLQTKVLDSVCSWCSQLWSVSNSAPPKKAAL